MSGVKRYEEMGHYMMLQFLNVRQDGSEPQVVDPEDSNACRAIKVMALKEYPAEPSLGMPVRRYMFRTLDQSGAVFVNEPISVLGVKPKPVELYTLTCDDVSVVDARYIKAAFKDNEKIMGMIAQVEEHQKVKIGNDIMLNGEKILNRPARANRYSFSLDM
ncbi:hypothetical protein ACTG16_21945 [Aeromonas sp. 23P]|uniref:hypothetical protein n=1 Tax=Aeromonas sp. 23P TaxID=3452716 RepID=UPI003F7AF475|nr:hypothetical protein [Aeromonas veronii]